MKWRGAIVEAALFQAIAERIDPEAENTVKFFANRNASDHVEGRDFESEDGFRACLNTSVPYCPEGAKHELDIASLDHKRRCIVALKAKRGNGHFGRSRRDPTVKSTPTVRRLLAGTAVRRCWDARRIKSRILAYWPTQPEGMPVTPGGGPAIRRLPLPEVRNLPFAAVSPGEIDADRAGPLRNGHGRQQLAWCDSRDSCRRR